MVMMRAQSTEGQGFALFWAGYEDMADAFENDVGELVHLAANYQLFIGEGRKVALVLAGLPKKTTELVDDDRVSFLQRPGVGG